MTIMTSVLEESKASSDYADGLAEVLISYLTFDMGVKLSDECLTKGLN